MGRKKKKKTRSTPKAAGKTGAAYWLERAQRFAATGRDDKLDEALGRAFGDDVGARFTWLLTHRPSRIELSSSPSDAELAAVRDSILILDEAALDVIGLPTGWLAQARTLHAANRALSQGRDGLAMDQLRSLGRRTHFADAARFLRGLAAWYGEDDAGAQRLLDPLRASLVYGASVAAMLHTARAVDDGAAGDGALGDGALSDGTLSEAAQRALEHLGPPADVLETLLDAIEHQRPGRALIEYGKLHVRYPSLRGQLRVFVAPRLMRMAGDSMRVVRQLKAIDEIAPIRATIAEGGLHEQVTRGQRPAFWLDPVRRTWPDMDIARAEAALLAFVAPAALNEANALREPSFFWSSAHSRKPT